MRILPSPDGRWGIIEEASNLILLDRGAADRRTAITSDGEAFYGYGTRSGASSTARSEPGQDSTQPPVGVWSPDSRLVAVHRLDERMVGEFHLVEHLVGSGGRRTAVRSYRHPLAGEEEVPEAELWIIEIESGRRTMVDLPAQKLLWLTPIELGRVWWAHDASRLYLLASERGERALELYEINPSDGSSRRILREAGPSFVEANLDIARPPNVRVLPGGDEVIWFSERTGWGHLELWDARTRRLIRSLTQGDWVVRDIIHLDPSAREIWFTAGGRESGRDPYFRHLYRVSLDGGEPVLLTPEDADHEIGLETEAGTVLVVDEFARLHTPTISVTRDLWSGEVVQKLAERPPVPTTAESFEVLARDGITPLYGVVFRPTRFDPERRYPVIDYVYGFPQTISTPKRIGGGPVASPGRPGLRGGDPGRPGNRLSE